MSQIIIEGTVLYSAFYISHPDCVRLILTWRISVCSIASFVLICVFRGPKTVRPALQSHLSARKLLSLQTPNVNYS